MSGQPDRGAHDRATADAFLRLLGGDLREPLWLPVLSGSMAPLLVPGDEILIAPCSAEPVFPGEVVVFRQGVTLTVHRIIYRKKNRGGSLLYQKGDAMDLGGFIPADSVVGRCDSRRRDGAVALLTEIDPNRNEVARIRAGMVYYTTKEFIRWLKKKVRISRSG